MIKNTSGQKVGVQMVSATDGSAFTGSVTAFVTGDAGTQAQGTVGSGACTHEGNGYHTYAPSQAETNYDLIGFTFTGTGAVPQTVQVFTRASAPDVTVTSMGANTLTASALASDAVAEIQSGLATTSNVSAVETDTQDIQSRLPAALTSNGNMKSSLLEIISTALSEGATGRLAAAWQGMFNVTSPVLTAQSVNQTGDAYGRLGAPAGASVSADILAIDNFTDDLESRIGTPSNLGSGATISANLVDIEGQTDDIGAAGAGLTAIPDSAGVTTLLSRIPAALFSGITSLAQWLGLIAGKQTGNSTARTEVRATGAGSGTFDETTDSVEAIRDRGDAAWTTGTSLDAAGIRSAVGLASANLDTQLDALPTNAELATALGTADDAVLAAIAALNNLSQANVRTAVGLASANLDTQLDALPTNSELATALAAITLTSAERNALADAVLIRSASNVEASAGEHTLCTVILAMLENSMAGTTLTIKRTDGTTTHVTKTLTKDAAAEPITGIN